MLNHLILSIRDTLFNSEPHILVIMKIDFTTEIKTVDGQPIPTADKKPFLLKQVVVNVLLANPKEGQKADPPEEMVKNYDLSLRVQKSTGLIDVSIDEVKKIKDKIAQSYGTLIYGQIHHIFESS